LNQIRQKKILWRVLIRAVSSTLDKIRTITDFEALAISILPKRYNIAGSEPLHLFHYALFHAEEDLFDPFVC
jgi:hypothetical protein